MDPRFDVYHFAIAILVWSVVFAIVQAMLWNVLGELGVIAKAAALAASVIVAVYLTCWGMDFNFRVDRFQPTWRETWQTLSFSGWRW